MTSPDKIKDWREELREYFDKTLKAKKPTMKNLDRELIVNFVSNLIQARNREIIEKLKKEIKTEKVCAYCLDKGMMISNNKKERCVWCKPDKNVLSPDQLTDLYKDYNQAIEKVITTLTGEDNE